MIYYPLLVLTLWSLSDTAYTQIFRDRTRKPAWAS